MRGNRHEVTIDNKTFWVDSNQEETLIRWIEENGFHDRWRRLNHGINVDSFNYTPDLELSIQFEGMTHRALVESKPTVKAFEPDHLRRMSGVAKHYNSKILLLYAHDIRTWYRIDGPSGRVTEFGVPVPGEILITKLWKPITIRAPKIRAHTYRRRLIDGRKITFVVLGIIQKCLMSIFGAYKKPRRRYYRRTRRDHRIK